MSARSSETRTPLQPAWTGKEVRIQSLISSLVKSTLDNELGTVPLHRALQASSLVSSSRGEKRDLNVSQLRAAFEAQSEKMKGIAFSLLSSRMQPDLSSDPVEAAVQIRNRIMRLVPNGPHLLQALEHIQILGRARDSGLQHQNSILYLLTALANNAKQKDTQKGTVSILALSGNKSSVNSRSSHFATNYHSESHEFERRLMPPTSFTTQHNRVSAIGYAPRPSLEAATTLAAATRPTAASLALARGVHSNVSNRTSKQQGTPEFTQESPNCFSEVPESALLLDLIPVLRGQDGQYIKFYNDYEAFLVRPEVGVSLSQRALVKRIGDLGHLFRKVEDAIEPVVNAESAPGGFNMSTAPVPNGLTRQAFAQALSDELVFFTQVLSIFQSQVAPDNSQSSIVCANLTLRKLLAWLQDAQSRLKILAAFAEATHNLEGGMLLTEISAFTLHGDEIGVAEVAKRVIRVAGRPLIAFLHYYMTRGEVMDPFREFFVKERHSVQSEDYWYARFFLEPSLIPKGITREVAEKILTIGKTVAFIRQKCSDPTFSISLDPNRLVHLLNGTTVNNGTAMATSGFVSTLGDVQVRALYETLDRAERQASARLMSLLRVQFDFDSHFKALRNYLLHGKGDFVRQLIEVGQEEFSKPASNLLKHSALSLVESACAGSTARFESQNILGRIRVRLNRTGEGEPGWNAFTLDYYVDGPLTVVFDSATVEKYLAISSLLWRIKRHEASLHDAWRRQCSESRQLRALTGGSSRRRTRVPESSLIESSDTASQVDRMLRRLQIIRHNMAHTLGFVNAHFSNHVIEAAWTEFDRRLRQALSSSVLGNNNNNQSSLAAKLGLDEITALHREYIETIATGLFLSNESELASILRENLFRILDCVSQFSLFHTKVFDYFVKESVTLAENRGTLEDAALRKQQQQLARLVEKLGDHLASTEKRYNEALGVFLRSLSRYGRLADAEQMQQLKKQQNRKKSSNAGMQSLEARARVAAASLHSRGVQKPPSLLPLIVPDSMRTAGLGVLIDFNEFYDEQHQALQGASQLQPV